MRGTHAARAANRMAGGIIPAYAGNTVRQEVLVFLARDHPRVCGEHQLPERYRYLKKGSSPRMRGTRPQSQNHHRWCTIIPAYAGNTLYPTWFSPWWRDHPRVCGEHLLSGHHSGRRPGIIPAYAGNTVMLLSSATVNWDHPRVCGEHAADSLAFEISPGSSPRMRGTPSCCQPNPAGFGIIPAYAGNTIRPATVFFVFWDHPRVCGEHAYPADNIFPTVGSSPRMRGTH